MGEQERVPPAIGSNYERLRQLKRRYASDHVFHYTSGIFLPRPPRASCSLQYIGQKAPVSIGG
ncbi:MAG: BBE domain-containing protein [Ktedonobacterales bacterium]